MGIFKKRESFTENITYMAIMAAINLIFVLLTTYVLPILFFILVFILPLSSAIVCIFCKKRYYLIYAIVTIGICLLCTMGNITDTLFYIIPSIISGFVFGILIEHKVPTVWIILASTVICVAFNFLSIPVIQALYNTNIVQTFAQILGLKDSKYLSFIMPCFFLILSFAQSILSFIVIKAELPKMGIQVMEEKFEFSLFTGSLVTLVIIIFSSVYFCEYCYFFTIIFAYFTVFIIIELILKNSIPCLIACGAAILVTLFLFGLFYQKMPVPMGLLLINSYFVQVLLIGIISTVVPVTPRKR